MRSGRELVRYDHVDGVGHFVYDVEADGKIVEEEAARFEPTEPSHLGWDASKVLATRPRDEMIYDALFVHAVRCRAAH